MSDTEIVPFSKLVEGRMSELLKVLPNEDNAKSFARIAVTALNKNPSINACTRESILACIFDLAAINLVPNTPDGYAYLIPYGNILTVQIGYMGFCHLCYRTGQVRIIKSGIVRDGDKFEAGTGTGDNAFVRHEPMIGVGRNERPVLAAWAAVEMMNGGRSVEIVDQDELKKIEVLANRKKESPAWKGWADQMRRKSAIKRLLKTLKIAGMECVAAAIEMDNKGQFELPAPKEHRLTFGEDLSGEHQPPENEVLQPVEHTGPTANGSPSQPSEPQDEKGYLF